MKRNNKYLIGNKFACGRGPNKTSFKAGLVPWNKGIKKITSEKSRATCFKKGQVGIRRVPVGTITICKDRSGTLRRRIKTTHTGHPSDWKTYATWLWEKHHGKIPDGMFVHHLDGDALNDALSNYALTTRATHILQHRHDLIESRKRIGSSVGKGYIRAG